MKGYFVRKLLSGHTAAHTPDWVLYLDH